MSGLVQEPKPSLWCFEEAVLLKILLLPLRLLWMLIGLVLLPFKLLAKGCLLAVVGFVVLLVVVGVVILLVLR